MAAAHGIEVPRREGYQVFRSVWEPPDIEVSTISPDLAKNIFQVHGINTEGEVIIGRILRPAQVLTVFAKLPPCLVDMEVCGTAHIVLGSWPG